MTTFAPEKPKVLYIDDDEDNLTVFKITFRQYYQIFTALGAEQARQVLQNEPVQIIITDQRMPGTTGTDFLRSVIPEHPEIVRMVITGFSDVGAVITAINDAGVYRYITKPWDENDLKTTIDGAAELYSLKKRNEELLHYLEIYNKQLEETVMQRTEALRLSNEELLRTNEQLQQSNREKHELLGIVSHDLRNPLSTILGTSDLIQSQPYGALDPEYLSLNAIINDSSRHLLRLMNNLLDLNAIETGSLSMNTIEFNPTSLIQSVVESYHVRARAKQLSLHFSATPVPFIKADEDMVRQILDNLLSNAVKYSPADKHINVRLEFVPEPQPAVRLSVQDEGPGISDSDKTKLFGKFTRLSARPTGGEDSTGLGLSIVKKLADTLGASVECHSTEGEGATFVLTFPALHHGHQG